MKAMAMVELDYRKTKEAAVTALVVETVRATLENAILNGDLDLNVRDGEDTVELNDYKITVHEVDCGDEEEEAA